MNREGLLFAIVLVGIAWLVKAVQVPYADEVWLISEGFSQVSSPI